MNTNRLEQYRNLFETDFQKLSRVQELGEHLGFLETSEKIKEMLDGINKIRKNNNKTKISKNIEEEILKITNTVSNVIAAIQEYKPPNNNNNTITEREEIIKITDIAYNLYLDKVYPIVERIDFSNNNPGNLEVANLLKTLEDKKVEMSNTLFDIQSKLGATGGQKGSNFFNDQSEEYKKHSNRWLWTSIIFIGIFVFTIGLIIFGKWKQLNIGTAQGDYALMAQIVVNKILVISILYLIIYESIKNYKVNRHHYLTNKHRSLCVRVYPILEKSTNDPSQTDLIIAQASKAIFEFGDSGYINEERNKNPINLTEIINKIIDKNVGK